MNRARWGDRKKQVLEEINATWRYRPSLAALAAWLDCSIASVQYAIDSLEREGKVMVFNRGRNRIDGSALRIVPGNLDTSGLDTLKPNETDPRRPDLCQGILNDL